MVAITNPTTSVITGSAITTCPVVYQIPIGLFGAAGETEQMCGECQVMNQYDTNKILFKGHTKLFQINLEGVD